MKRKFENVSNSQKQDNDESEQKKRKEISFLDVIEFESKQPKPHVSFSRNLNGEPTITWISKYDNLPILEKKKIIEEGREFEVNSFKILDEELKESEYFDISTFSKENNLRQELNNLNRKMKCGVDFFRAFKDQVYGQGTRKIILGTPSFLKSLIVSGIKSGKKKIIKEKKNVDELIKENSTLKKKVATFKDKYRKEKKKYQIAKKEIEEMEKKLLNSEDDYIFSLREEQKVIICEANKLSYEEALSVDLKYWEDLVKSNAPKNYNFVKCLLENTYDEKLNELRESKSRKVVILTLLMCRNRTSHFTKFSMILSVLMKGFGVTKDGMNFLNQLMSISVSSTLLFSVMKPYAKKKVEEEIKKQKNNVIRFVIDNFALKFHNRRKHVETLTKLIYTEGKSLEMTPKEMRREEITFKKTDFFLPKDNERLIEKSGYNCFKKQELTQFCFKYDKKNRKEVIAMCQKIPAKSSSDVDVCECLIEMDELIDDKYVRKLTSDQQIVEKCLRFQEMGYFTNWIFEYGKLHGEKDLEILIMDFSYNFCLEDLAIELGEYYINPECKYIEKTYFHDWKKAGIND